MTDGPPPPGTLRMLGRFALGALGLVLLAGIASATALLLQLDAVADEVQTRSGPPIAAKVVEPTRAGSPQTLLLLGSDRRWADRRRGDPARSDTIMLVRLDPRRQVISTLSIPRDLRVQIPGHGLRKINDAYLEGGPDLAAETVRNLTGLKLHHVVNVNFSGFRRAVNLVGCVYVDIDRRYFHSNKGVPIGQRFAAIDLKPGLQRVCGQKGLDYVRHRHQDSDLVRAARQQDFLRAAKDQISTGSLFSDRNRLIEIFGDSAQTNRELHTSQGLLRLAKLAMAAGGSPVRQVKFPASYTEEDEIQYVVAAPAQIAAAVDEFLHPPETRARPANGRPRPSGAASRPRPWRLARELEQARLEPAAEPGRVMARHARRKRLELPFRIPLARAPGDRYVDPSPRVYTLRDRAGRPHPAYRLVIVHNAQDGQYYGVQGTQWRSPPILAHPSEIRRVGGRRLELFRTGSRLRYVAWRTPTAVYWVSNTLTLDLSNRRMITIARSLSVSTGKSPR